MGWWSLLRRERATQWHAGPVLPGTGVPAPGTALVVDSCYLSVFLESLYIRSVRKGLTRFYGAVTSTCSMPSKKGDRAQSVVVTTPQALQNADAKRMDRVVVDRMRLFGPVPYTGGDLEIEAGLFSTPALDLIEPYLAVIEDIARLASVPFVDAVKPFVEPVTRGLRLLLGEDDGKSTLEIGLTTVQSPPNAGWFAVARIPAGDPLHFDPARRMLIVRGVPIDQPHMVLSVETTTQRGDWQSIPPLLEAWNDIKRAAERDDMAQAQQAVSAFRVRAKFSPDLVPVDADAIVRKAVATYEAAFETKATAAVGKPAIPEFASLNLYG